MIVSEIDNEPNFIELYEQACQTFQILNDVREQLTKAEAQLKQAGSNNIDAWNSFLDRLHVKLEEYGVPSLDVDYDLMPRAKELTPKYPRE